VGGADWVLKDLVVLVHCNDAIGVIFVVNELVRLILGEEIAGGAAAVGESVDGEVAPDGASEGDFDGVGHFFLVWFGLGTDW